MFDVCFCAYLHMYAFTPMSTVPVYLCDRVFQSDANQDLMPLLCIVCTYSYDVNKVIFSQCVQDCIYGVFGYGESESLHTATDIHHNHHIFGRSGCLDIPAGSSDDFIFTTMPAK